MGPRYIEVVIRTIAPGANPHIDAVHDVLKAHDADSIWQYRGPQDHETHTAVVVTRIAGNSDLRGPAGDALVTALEALKLPSTAKIRDVLH